MMHVYDHTITIASGGNLTSGVVLDNLQLRAATQSSLRKKRLFRVDEEGM